jgi:ribosomal protein S27AE
MDPNWRQPYGLRPTLRHLMILVVHFALLFSLVAPLIRGGTYGVITILLPLSPPLLAVLVLAFDRPGLAKYWLVGLLGSLFQPSLMVWFDLIAVLAFDQGSRPVGAFLLLLLVMNSIGLWSIVRVVKRLPRRCPDCGLRSLLPLGNQSSRFHWCASCGYRERDDRPDPNE